MEQRGPTWANMGQQRRRQQQQQQQQQQHISKGNMTMTTQLSISCIRKSTRGDDLPLARGASEVNGTVSFRNQTSLVLTYKWSH